MLHQGDLGCSQRSLDLLQRSLQENNVAPPDEVSSGRPIMPQLKSDEWARKRSLRHKVVLEPLQITLISKNTLLETHGFWVLVACICANKIRLAFTCGTLFPSNVYLMITPRLLRSLHHVRIGAV